jgi:hypothetical protein
MKLRSIGPWSSQGGFKFFWEFFDEICFHRRAPTGHNLDSTHRKRSGATGTDNSDDAQPDCISIERHGHAARANMVPELIAVAVGVDSDAGDGSLNCAREAAC